MAVFYDGIRATELDLSGTTTAEVPPVNPGSAGTSGRFMTTCVDLGSEWDTDE